MPEFQEPSEGGFVFGGGFIFVGGGGVGPKEDANFSHGGLGKYINGGSLPG